MPHTLLLADDSVTIQRVIELTFADEDVRVIAVGDGRQAIERAQAERPDIVLADVGMPELDGYEVAAFLKRTPGLSDVPVLLLTGAFEPIDEGRAREVGCDGVLVKPFEPQMVISRVKELIRGPRRNHDALPSFGPPTTESAPAAAPARSTDEYFERLDAAFASIGTPTEPAPPAAPGASQPVDPSKPEGPAVSTLASELEGWSPVSLDDLPSTDAPGDTAPAAAPPITEDVQGEPPAPTPLAQAFAALLAAERGKPFEHPAADALAGDRTFLDLVTERVIERLADRAVRDIVLDVAERLVREEIERIKRESADRAPQV